MTYKRDIKTYKNTQIPISHICSLTNPVYISILYTIHILADDFQPKWDSN